MQHKKLTPSIVVAFLIVLTIISIWQKREFYTIEHKKPSGYITYTVKPYECIDGIAERYKPKYMKLENYRSEIQVLNNKTEMICPGTKLRLPIYDDK